MRVGTMAIAIFVSAGLAQEPNEREQPGPIDTPFVDTTGVSLMLLDVEVTDKSGRPVPGLTREDFTVRLNGRTRTIYSVDDLCPCVPQEPTVAGTAAPSRDAKDVAPGSPPVTAVGGAPVSDVPPDLPSFVLYLDFSQLQIDGRINAIAEARRWVRETMRPGDRAMLAAYASLPGLRELTSFTDDRKRLVAVLDEVEADMTWFDPFPSQFDDRVLQCGTGGYLVCLTHAKDEYQHGRRSLKAFKRFLTRLEGTPGRKVMLFFNQNGVLYPARFFGMPEIQVGDHVSMLDQVGAEATNARTTVYPAYSGDQPNFFEPLSSQAVNFGANLADFTGGEYNRTAGLLPELTSSAGRGCACIYRIAIKPPQTDRWKVYTAVVTAGGRRVPHSFRIQHLTEMDRWWRRATDAILAPERATGLAVATGFFPVEHTDNGWRAAVQIAFDADALLLLPGVDGSRGRWEVGALLQRGEDRAVGEMLGVSEIRRAEGQSTGSLIVHQRVFDRLKPGRYRVGAFVRDQNAGSVGGAEAEVVLPRADTAGIVGPVLLRFGRRWVLSELPLWKKDDDTDRTRSAEVRSGFVCAPAAPVVAGETLQARSWLCSSKDDPDDAPAMRYISGDGTPLFRFEVDDPGEDDACFQIIDLIETGGLEPGRYAYHVQWLGQSESVVFEVAAGSSEPVR